MFLYHLYFVVLSVLRFLLDQKLLIAATASA